MKKWLGDPSPLFYIVVGVLWLIAAILRVFEKNPAASITLTLAAGILYCTYGIICWYKEKHTKK